MELLSDEQLVAEYLVGERQALDFLIKRYLTVIYNYALKFTKEPEAADDLTQEIFVKVWKKIKKFDQSRKFKNWLYALAKNTCLDYLKKRKLLIFSDINPAGDELFFENLIKDALPSPQLELEERELAARLDRAIERLPENYKETVKLRYRGGYKFREIAELMKTSIETVKSRNRRALKYLRKMLGK